MTRGTPKLLTTLAAVLVCLSLIGACSSNEDTGTFTAESGFDSGELKDPGDCLALDMAVSSEKVELLGDLANEFNKSEPTTRSGKCIFVRPEKKSSGAAATALEEGWNEDVDGPKPIIWSPASSAWGAVLNQRLADAGKEPLAPTGAEPFMLTPLVIAMPKPMADAIGYPATPIGFADLARLAADPQGWAAYGRPEWGPFRLGKTNPNFSTSGLSALIAQTYAATGKTTGLSPEDLDDPTVVQFSKDIESAVVHYGDITMTFLNNWFRADQRGTSLTYASAVAVEEKSVIDYNRGNPDGVVSPGEELRKPKIPLVAVYPKEGTLFSDNPFFVLDADWVTDDLREGAKLFEDFVQKPENQKRVVSFGFRPGNSDVATTDPVSAANGVDPTQPQTLLEVPAPKIMTGLLDRWALNRKTGRVLMVLDVSGSMGDSPGPDSSDTKLELAKQAAIDALAEFKVDDEVGLRIFSTGLGPQQDQTFLDLQPVEPIGPKREALASSIDGLVPTNGTPLYDVALASYRAMREGYDPSRINAIILLTDGVNDDGQPDDDADQRSTLLKEIRSGVTGESGKPVRIFTIGYGSDADMSALTSISEASDAAAYNAADAKSIARVFQQVVSNF